MNDNEMLNAMRSSLTGVKDSLCDVRMDRPAAAITARARGRRLRRGLSVAGAGGAALGTTLALVLSGGALPAGGTAAGHPVHVSLDGFTVNTSANGLVDVTVSELKHPAVLRRVLAEAGIPAIINVGKVCMGGRSLPQLRQVIVNQQSTTAGVVFVLNPAAIPAGAKLDLSFSASTSSPASSQSTSARPEPVVAVGVFGLVKDGTPLTCIPFPGGPVHSGG